MFRRECHEEQDEQDEQALAWREGCCGLEMPSDFKNRLDQRN